ncbi:MAG: DUF302 domain-containing protein [Acidimicrobiales bacterium]
MNYGRTIEVASGYEETVTKVRQAFKEQGFGILTEIDVKATLAEKLGTEMEPFVILGACNPQLAHRALEVDRQVGLLLPCNVVVRQGDEGRTVVQALDPAIMSEVPEIPGLKPIADEAAERVQAALDALAAA